MGLVERFRNYVKGIREEDVRADLGHGLREAQGVDGFDLGFLS